ncbi:MAG TPA: outer membrane protein assembly factor BamA [Clostridia bacterium]|nr:outer membrane protein assembly factor BamA [Clostridia bacterium]
MSEGVPITGIHHVNAVPAVGCNPRRNRKIAFLLCLFVLLCCGLAFAQQGVVEEVIIHGNRRIPADTIRARLFTRPGDVYDQPGIERDFNSLWNTGYFDDLRIEREETPKGWRLHVYVKEKPTIREIKYDGLKSVSQSDVLEKFKERKVGLTQESQYDPTRVKKAEVVLKELLAARGRQFATIRTEIKPIPPAAVSVSFIVKEGTKVKVGNIRFEGNKKVSSRFLRSAMRNSRPIGIPHSIILESLFAKTFDATKLSEDAERVRVAYQEKGYFKALVQDPKTKIRDAGGVRWYFPFKANNGKVVDITVPVEEGERFHLKEINFSGNKAITNTALLRRLFKMKEGDLFNTSLVRKGLDELRKAYGSLGYINFTSVPNTVIDDEKKQITINVDVDEGKPFYVRRIEFAGNSTTRDKVIRRELALEEGQVYNSQLWELSLLRLNQLNYFEPLKPEEDSEVHQNNQESTVDITLKVKEKGKNSIGLTGGVSGLAGSFIGLNYETNNFLGMGETLHVEANVGSRERNLVFGFTEPYMFDRPLQFGFTVFTRKYNYDQAKEAEISSNQQLNLPQSFLESLQNFTQSSTGFTVSASYPLHRSFKRVGLTYSLDTSSVEVFTDASRGYFEALAFRGISGPDSLKGVITSKFVPTFSFSTIDNPMRPHSGHSLFLGTDISGLGGNVQMLRPVMEYKRFMPMKGIHFADAQTGQQTLGIRLQSTFVTGYAGRVAPPFERMYTGGDNDIRGFDIRSISPVAFLVDSVSMPLTNPDGSVVPIDPSNPRRGSVTVPIPVHRLVFPGGDTSIVGNVEYRVPIAGPVTLAAFVDSGMNFVLRNSQLRLSDVQVNNLNNTPFGCPVIAPGSFTCGGTQNLTFQRELTPLSKTNYIPRMSTGLELQVIMPVVNAPFRIYYAYNPLRLDTFATPPSQFNRSMFPVGAAGDFTFQQAQALYGSAFMLREPRKTVRFTVSTTF